MHGICAVCMYMSTIQRKYCQKDVGGNQPKCSVFNQSKSGYCSLATRYTVSNRQGGEVREEANKTQKAKRERNQNVVWNVATQLIMADLQRLVTQDLAQSLKQVVTHLDDAKQRNDEVIFRDVEDVAEICLGDTTSDVSGKLWTPLIWSPALVTLFK